MCTERALGACRQYRFLWPPFLPRPSLMCMSLRAMLHVSAHSPSLHAPRLCTLPVVTRCVTPHAPRGSTLHALGASCLLYASCLCMFMFPCASCLCTLCFMARPSACADPLHTPPGGSHRRHRVEAACRGRAWRGGATRHRRRLLSCSPRSRCHSSTSPLSLPTSPGHRQGRPRGSGGLLGWSRPP